MLVDKNITIKHKNQFISKVYYQNKIIYERIADITVDIIVDAIFVSGASHGQILFKIDGKTIHTYTLEDGSSEGIISFKDTYQVERGSIVSFEWARIPRGYEAIWDRSFDPSGTVVTKSKYFSVGIQKANTGGDIM